MSKEDPRVLDVSSKFWKKHLGVTLGAYLLIFIEIVAFAADEKITFIGILIAGTIAISIGFILEHYARERIEKLAQGYMFLFMLSAFGIGKMMNLLRAGEFFSAIITLSITLILVFFIYRSESNSVSQLNEKQ